MELIVTVCNDVDMPNYILGL